MKKHILLTSYLILFLGINLPVLAQTIAPSPSNTSTDKPQLQICKALAKTCEAANFTVSGSAGKNLLLDCIKPIMSGENPPKLKINQEDIQQCKNDINSQPCAKIISQCNAAGYQGDPNKLLMFDCVFPLMKGKIIAGVNPSPEDYTACKDVIDKEIQNQPCLSVMIACKAAGYSPDAKNGQVFARNCYNPILEGQIVIGVTIDPAIAQACKNQTSQGAPKTKPINH